MKASNKIGEALLALLIVLAVAIFISIFTGCTTEVTEQIYMDSPTGGELDSISLIVLKERLYEVIDIATGESVDVIYTNPSDGEYDNLGRDTIRVPVTSSVIITRTDLERDTTAHAVLDPVIIGALYSYSSGALTLREEVWQ